MAKTPTRSAPYQDLLQLPDNVVGEIIAGELVTHTRPSPKPSLAASALGSVVFNYFDRSSADGPGGWWILDEPECHLGEDVIVPDIAGWRQSTMPALPETAWFDFSPDWVCEIISPSTHKRDRSIKRDIYAREQIGHYWIVDPLERLIEVFELTDGQWMLKLTAQDNLKVALAPFGEVPFDLSRLWA